MGTGNRPVSFPGLLSRSPAQPVPSKHEGVVAFHRGPKSGAGWQGCPSAETRGGTVSLRFPASRGDPPSLAVAHRPVCSPDPPPSKKDNVIPSGPPG